MKLLKLLLVTSCSLLSLFVPVAAREAENDDIADAIGTEIEEFLNDQVVNLVIEEDIVKEIKIFGITVTATFSGVVLKADSYQADVKINELGETTNATATITTLDAEVEISDLSIEISGFFRSRTYKGSAVVGFENVTYFMDVLADVNARRKTAEVTCMHIRDEIVLVEPDIDADLPSIIEDYVVDVFDDVINDEDISSAVIYTVNMLIDDGDLLCKPLDE